MPPKPKTDNTAMRELKGQLKSGAPGRLYVFYGEEVYLRDYYVGQLKQALLPAGLEDFNLHTAQGKDCSVAWLEQAVDCLPMMSQRTLILVTDFDLFSLGEKDREHLTALLSDLPDYCCLTFVYDLLPYKADGRSRLAAATLSGVPRRFSMQMLRGGIGGSIFRIISFSRSSRARKSVGTKPMPSSDLIIGRI